MYRTDFWTLWENARVGWSERTSLKHVYYQVWNRSPVQVGCMRQVLRAGALGRPRGMGWGGRWERGSGWGTHVNPWLIHVNVWQQPLQYCKVISLQLIKINGKKEKEWICNTLSTQADFISYSTSLKNHGVSSWNKTDKRETMHIYLLKRGKDNDVGEMGKWQVHVFISASKKIEHTL